MPIIEDEDQARMVIESLRSFQADIQEIMNPLGDKNSVSMDEKLTLQVLLTSLKERLKAASKTGTVDGSKRPLTPYEQAYFEPAVSSAIANCNIAVNSHPIKSNWFSCLYGMEMDITHLLYQLEEGFSDV